MSIQHVGSIIVYVVEFDVLPALPITGEGIERPYAQALTEAIELGVVTQPGKYGIQIDGSNWRVYEIQEDSPS